MKTQNNAPDFLRRLDDNNGFRFYDLISVNPETKEEAILATYPSVTSKLDAVYPKNPGLIDWIRKNGNEGKEKFEKAGEEGTEVHVSIDLLLKGEVVNSTSMSKKVKKCVQAFIDWYIEFQPVTLKSEQMVYDSNYEFAGTFDYVCTLNTKDYVGTYLIDFKTSASLQDVHKVQVSAYWYCLKEKYPDLKTALLHLGNKTKKKWSFSEFDPDPEWEQFISLNIVFKQLFGSLEPDRTTYPDFFTLHS